MKSQSNDARTELPPRCPLCRADALKGPTVHHSTYASANYWCGTSAGDDMRGHMYIHMRGRDCVAQNG